MIELNVRFDTGISQFGRAAVNNIVKAMDKYLKADEITIGVRITTALKVRQLNKRYAGKDEFTDVLSFNYAEGALAPQHEKAGDIVISIQHIKDQAKQAKTTPSTELALLMLHGLLHILGFDHQNPQQRAEVDKLQASIMHAAGLSYRDFAWQD